MTVPIGLQRDVAKLLERSESTGREIGELKASVGQLRLKVDAIEVAVIRDGKPRTREDDDTFSAGAFLKDWRVWAVLLVGLVTGTIPVHNLLKLLHFLG